MNKVLRDKFIESIKDAESFNSKKFEEIKDGFQEEEGPKDFLEKLIKENIIEEADLLPMLSKAFDIPPIDLGKVKLKPEVFNLLPRKVMEKNLVLPVARIGNVLIVAMCAPVDILVLDDIKSVTNCEITPVLAKFSKMESELVNIFCSMEAELDTILQRRDIDLAIDSDPERFDEAKITEQSNEAPIVKMVDLIIAEAIEKGASDIHMEPQEKNLRIRYRIDGSLQEAFKLPKKNQNAIIARIKIMSDLDITETRIPQDGRFRVKVRGKDIDFRVSILPITNGNKVVLRALDKSNLSIGLDVLGFLPQPLSDFKTALANPYGIILVTGPTGSGKSTTLYSILNEKNTPAVNILTVENPVEYQVEGITQIAAKPEIGLDFASGLKSILRQSPDVIMVGEIRDLETADIAIKASLTGHMVLSTLHTNDSVGAITRLENMGIEPFLVASSMVMACAQRLLRRLCPHCKIEADVSPRVIDKIKEKYPEAEGVDVFYTKKGCSKCGESGYKGRLGTLETLLVDDVLRTMINKRKSEAHIRSYLDEKNVRTLRDNAMIKFIKGLTSLEEVYRVT